MSETHTEDEILPPHLEAILLKRMRALIEESLTKPAGNPQGGVSTTSLKREVVEALKDSQRFRSHEYLRRDLEATLDEFPQHPTKIIYHVMDDKMKNNQVAPLAILSSFSNKESFTHRELLDAVATGTRQTVQVWGRWKKVEKEMGNGKHPLSLRREVFREWLAEIFPLVAWETPEEAGERKLRLEHATNLWTLASMADIDVRAFQKVTSGNKKLWDLVSLPSLEAIIMGIDQEVGDRETWKDPRLQKEESVATVMDFSDFEETNVVAAVAKESPKDKKPGKTAISSSFVGKVDVKFALDGGSAITYVSEALAAKLKLEPGVRVIESSKSVVGVTKHRFDAVEQLAFEVPLGSAKLQVTAWVLPESAGVDSAISFGRDDAAKWEVLHDYKTSRARLQRNKDGSGIWVSLSYRQPLKRKTPETKTH